MLLAHVSDIHLGKRQYGLDARAKDYEGAFMKAVGRLVELREQEGLEAVLVTGDVFDSPRPTPSMYMTAIEGFTRLREAGVKVFAIRGNHDASPINPVDNPLKVLDNTGVLRLLDDDFIDLGDARIVGIGCRPGDRGEEVLGKIRSMMGGRRTIVMLHQYVKGTPYKYTMPDLDYFAIGGELPSDPYYALGHIHEHNLRHPTLRARYAGSLETWDSSEFETYELVGGELRVKKMQDKKGFLLLDVDGAGEVKVSEVEVKGIRRMIRIVVGINKEEPRIVKGWIKEALDKVGVGDAYVEIDLLGIMHDGARLRDYDLREVRAERGDALKIEIRPDLRKAGTGGASGGDRRYGINEIIRESLLNSMRNWSGSSQDKEKAINSVMEALDKVESGEAEKAMELIKQLIGLS